MTNRQRLLKLLRVTEILAAVALIFGSGLVYSGFAEPYISPPDPIIGEVDVLVFMIVGGGLIWLKPTQLLRNRFWQATVAEAGFNDERQQSSDSDEYRSTFQGRPIRVKTGSTTAFRKSTEQLPDRYTLVEAELNHDASKGVVIDPSDQDAFVTPYNVSSHTDYEANGLVAIGSSNGLAERVLSPPVQDALLSVEQLNQVYVGNAKAASDRLPEDDRMAFSTPPGITRAVDAAHDSDMDGGEWLGGNGWVTHLSSGVTLDEDELRQQAKAVATIADAFEKQR